MGEPSQQPQELKTVSQTNFSTEDLENYEKEAEMKGHKPEGRSEDLAKEIEEEETIDKIAEEVKRKIEKEKQKQKEEEKLESVTVKSFFKDSFDILSNLFTRAGWFQLIILFTIAFMQISGLGVIQTAGIMLALGAFCNYVKRALDGASWDPLEQMGIYDAVKKKEQTCAA